MRPFKTATTVRSQDAFYGLAFVVAYVLLDWASYLHPMYGLNITPWNPSLALGLVYWFRVGRRAALPWFAAILVSDFLIRGLPASLGATLVLSAVLTAGYGAMAELVRRRASALLLHDRQHLLSWLLIVIVGTLTTSGIYVSLLVLFGLIPVHEQGIALVRFWVGDCVGIVVTMPFLWLVLGGHQSLRQLLMRWETAGYTFLAVAMLWVSFGFGGAGEFQYFYLLFLPIVWAAARQGMHGAAIAAFILQAGIVVAVQMQNLVAVTVVELQMLGAVLAFVGFFIGVVVDEKLRVSDELRQTLRLAAAGEMAGALAHELNQPLTALSAYGSACEQLLDRGETGERMRETIRRMVAESYRAAEVVRRLRDFFRTGATRLEHVTLAELIAVVSDALLPRANRLGVALTIEPLPQSRLLADRLQLEVVLRNVLTNAFDAVADQPAHQRWILISAQEESADRVTLRVEDGGLGFSAEAASRLFEAFHSSKSSGMGLGLTISRAIVEAHGGSLVAEAADHGVFTVSLPTEKLSGNAS